MKLVTQWLLWILVLTTLVNCQSPSDSETLDEGVHIRLANEPDRLNPMLSRQGSATEIERYIFSPLEFYDPTTLQLRPVLLKERARVSTIQEGPSRGGLRYEMEILDEATWDDGSPITGHDYLFTMKAALNPAIANGSWRSFVSSIGGITIDSVNAKKFTAWMTTPYILGEEVVCGFSIYPEYIYDSARVLREFTFQELKDQNLGSEGQATPLTKWAEQFNSDRFSRSIVEGSGRYRFVEWQAGLQIRLQRKDNHWSNNIPHLHPLLEAFSPQVTFHLISDTQTSITSLKDGRLDIISDLTAEQFQSIEQYNAETNHLTLLQAPILQYYYIGYNNQQKFLKDKLVRKAISHAVDLDEIIAKLFKGLGSRTIGPIHPSKSYYNQDLSPIAFDLHKSSKYLSEAGWKPSTSSNFLSKKLDGRSEQLQLKILTSRSQLSQDIAIILKENAAKIGIGIELVPLEFRVLMQRVRTGDYDLACLANNQAPGLDDPYNNWHSDNASSVGNNYCKFQDDRCDEVIETIRVTLDEKVRNPLYQTFQEIIYEEQPALFLVAPHKAIATNNRLELKTTAIRPGYFANSARVTK